MEKLDVVVKVVDDFLKLVVVIDLDEMVIDNIVFFVCDLDDCYMYDVWDIWLLWECDGKFMLIFGVKEFLDYVNGFGVVICYILDWVDEQKLYMFVILIQFGLLQVSEENVLLLGLFKVECCVIVSVDYQIVLLIGDMLYDFDVCFRKMLLDDQKCMVVEESVKWGIEWIVLFNVSYGIWLKVLLFEWDVVLVIEVW